MPRWISLADLAAILSNARFHVDFVPFPHRPYLKAGEPHVTLAGTDQFGPISSNQLSASWGAFQPMGRPHLVICPQNWRTKVTKALRVETWNWQNSRTDIQANFETDLPSKASYEVQQSRRSNLQKMSVPVSCSNCGDQNPGTLSVTSKFASLNVHSPFRVENHVSSFQWVHSIPMKFVQHPCDSPPFTP